MMHHTQNNQEWNNRKKVLDTMIDLTANLAKSQYRELVLVNVPKKKIRVGYLFYRN